MPYPFPGMNPWLERPGSWRSIHTRLLVALADDLNARLPKHYQAEVEERVYLAALDDPELVGIPDVSVRKVAEASAAYTADVSQPVVVEIPYQYEITHRWLEVRDLRANEVVTVIEVLSPVNKRPGDGRDKHEAKRNTILESRTHLVEIDLLRAYPPMPVHWRGESQPSDYRILVSRAPQRPRAELYPFNLRDPIPLFRLTLREGETEPVINLGLLLRELYNRANYDLTIDYGQEPNPPLSAEDLAWARGLVMGDVE